jgi:hyperosmotically inducible protein
MKQLLCLGGATALLLSAAWADTAVSPDPTNSANNQATTATAVDQSNDQGDVKITARIRRHLEKDSRLSTNAKNVKIITSGGKVALRGPVDSADEKKIVCEHAAKVVGKENVDDQLTVK